MAMDLHWRNEDRVRLTALGAYATGDIRGPWHDADRVKLTPKGAEALPPCADCTHAERRHGHFGECAECSCPGYVDETFQGPGSR